MYLLSLLSFLESDSEFCSLLEFSFSRNESWLLSDLLDLSSLTLCGILLALGLEGYQKQTVMRTSDMMTNFPYICHDLTWKNNLTPNENEPHDLPDIGLNALPRSYGRLVVSEVYS